MKNYLELLQHLIDHGNDREDRTGVGTRGVFGYQMRFDLQKGFPLMTTKKIHFKSVVHELLWFLSGSGNVEYLRKNGVTIWDEWADEKGDLGPVYGVQWRHWDVAESCGHPSLYDKLGDQEDEELIGRCFEAIRAEKWAGIAFLQRRFGLDYATAARVVDELEKRKLIGFNVLRQVDQIAGLIKDLKGNPFSRRHIVTAWNPPLISRMKLPPCHTLWQCYVREVSAKDFGEGKILWPTEGAQSILEQPTALENHKWKFLSLHLYARSIDAFLGLPFNIASYALLLTMLANVVGMVPGELIISFGDLHLYKNHFDQAREQLKREPLELPRLILPVKPNIDDYKFEDVQLIGYVPHPPIKAPIAV